MPHRQHTSGGWRYRHMLVFDGERKVAGLSGLVDLPRALMRREPAPPTRSGGDAVGQFRHLAGQRCAW